MRAGWGAGGVGGDAHGEVGAGLDVLEPQVRVPHREVRVLLPGAGEEDTVVEVCKVTNPLA